MLASHQHQVCGETHLCVAVELLDDLLIEPALEGVLKRLVTTRRRDNTISISIIITIIIIIIIIIMIVIIIIIIPPHAAPAAGPSGRG
jgi:hypothetical protein